MMSTANDYGFPVGSRVVMMDKDPTGYVDMGMSGIVCHIVDIDCFGDNCNIGVEWNRESIRFHNCIGHCASSRGRYVPHTCLAHEDCDIGTFECSDWSIDLLLNIIS